MSQPLVEPIAMPQLTLGEGPHWNPATQKLYLVDIPKATVWSYCPKTEAVFSTKVEGCDTFGFATPVKGSPDLFVAGVNTSLRLFRWDGSFSDSAKFERVLQELPEEPKTNRINDGKADSTGRLWFGTMKGQNFLEEPREGSLYSWSKDSGLTKHFSGVGLSNGLAFDESRGALYYVDTMNQTVDGFDYEPASGKISNRRVVFNYAKNNLKCYPDGMTIDTDGKLYVACFSGSRVLKVDPSTGQLVSEISIPSKNVTSVAWGGPDLSDLYVTTGIDEEGGQGGETYRVRGLGAKGLPMYDAIV